MMTRRRFAFWLGFGLFSLADKLRADGLDTLAAATMRSADPATPSDEASPPTHWRTDEDDAFRWYERENYIDGQWVATGTTAPINKQTGARKSDPSIYLDDELLPAEIQLSEQARGRKVRRGRTPNTIRTCPSRNSEPVTADRPANGCGASTQTKSGFGSKRSRSPKPMSAA